MKILLFIGTLKTGGAERQMTLLARGLSNRGHDITVVTMFPGGHFYDYLLEIPDIQLFSLWPRRGRFLIVRVFQIIGSPFLFIRFARESDYCYSMLGTSNFIAWIASRFTGNLNLVWGIRSTMIGKTWKMDLFNKLCAIVSPSVKLIISNSYRGLESLKNLGFHSQKILVIQNGIDVDKFKFDQNARNCIRKRLSIPPDHRVVGIVARLVPFKDHTTFFKAAALLIDKIDKVIFIVVGDGPVDYVDELHMLVAELRLSERVIWIGNQTDVGTIYSALDVLVSSSSSGEGFSNVIGEAMSCAIPCVVTDVGDSALIVGDPKRIVNPEDPEMMASAIYKVLQTDKTVGELHFLRNRICSKFSVSNLLDQTEKALELLSKEND